MNIFAEEAVANAYDSYYETEFGRQVDELEKKALSEVIQEVPRGKMLEIGSGTGHWTEFFLEKGFNVTASDVAEAMLTHARRKLGDRVKFRKADVMNLPFECESLDVIAAITALEFCGDQLQAFAQIYKVLKPGGWLIVGCLNADSPMGKAKADDPVYSHGYFMSKTELETYLEGFGTPKIVECVHLSEKLELLNDSPATCDVPGAFMAACVKKD